MPRCDTYLAMLVTQVAMAVAGRFSMVGLCQAQRQAGAARRTLLHWLR